MEKKTMKNYREVKIDMGGIDMRYKNPLTALYQQEYALYLAMLERFAAVVCKSMCIESLMLYFKELPHAAIDPETNRVGKEGKRHMTQEGLVENMRDIISQTVIGNITFPMMNKCAAELYVEVQGDGSHKFIYTDGIYSFSVRLKNQKGKEICICVEKY